MSLPGGTFSSIQSAATSRLSRLVSRASNATTLRTDGQSASAPKRSAQHTAGTRPAHRAARSLTLHTA